MQTHLGPKTKGNNCGGMTLVEVLFSAMIFFVVLSACYMILISGSASWQVNSTKIELQQGLRRAMDWMEKDLRQAGTAAASISTVPADGVWYSTITFKTANGVSGGNIVWSTDTIRYGLGGTGSKQLQRIKGTETRIIANNMKTLQIRRLADSSDIVEVTMSAEKRATSGQTITMATDFKVKVRN